VAGNCRSRTCINGFFCVWGTSLFPRICPLAFTGNRDSSSCSDSLTCYWSMLGIFSISLVKNWIKDHCRPSHDPLPITNHHRPAVQAGGPRLSPSRRGHQLTVIDLARPGEGVIQLSLLSFSRQQWPCIGIYEAISRPFLSGAQCQNRRIPDNAINDHLSCGRTLGRWWELIFPWLEHRLDALEIEVVV